MMYVILEKRFTKLEILLLAHARNYRNQLTVMFGLLFFGGTTNVILSRTIMLMKLPRIPQILGYIFLGNLGGTPQFEIHIYSMTWFIPCT
jgi:hypothetical protein